MPRNLIKKSIKHYFLSLVFEQFAKTSTIKKNEANRFVLFCGSLKGSRTPHSAVKGRRLSRLTMRPCESIMIIIDKHLISQVF